jgi:hypothetical protein
MKRILVVFSLFCVLYVGLPVAAQEGDSAENTIGYGETVSGEITNREFEVEYSFTGNAEDVIIVLMNRSDGSELDNPAVIILNEEFDVVASKDSYASVTLIYELPSDGQYYAVATRRNGRAGESVGAYELTLLNPRELFADEPLEASANRDEEQYFVIRTSDNFSLQYTHNSGVFAPRINVSIINDEAGSLDVIAAMEGSRLGSGQLNINTSELDSGVFIIYTGRSSIYEYYSGEALADFTLLFTAQ